MILRSTGLAFVVGPLMSFLLLCITSPLAGQQRPPPDSLVQDSLRRARGDTLQAEADSMKLPPVLVKHASGPAVSLSSSVWEWTAEDLLREGAITLTDLLQRLPGVTSFRTGLFLQPEIIASLGGTRGRVQILLDGYELDPLTASSDQLARIALAEIRHLRVERRLDLLRIELSTLEATDGRPQSRIEAGVGEPNVNLFRGLFVVPKFLIGPLGFAIERVDTDGLRSSESADAFSSWAKWSWIRGSAGIQAEILQTTLNRVPNSPWPGESRRRDLIVRGRAPLVGGVVGEVFVGRSSFEIDTVTVAQDDSLRAPVIKADVVQWGARASYENPFAWADVTARFRNHEALPSAQVDAQAGMRLARLGSFSAAWSVLDWRSAGAASSFDLRLETVPFKGLSAFAEVAGGKRGGPSVYFDDPANVVLTERKAGRAGLAFQRWGINASGALLRLESDATQSFGLTLDSTDTPFPGGNPRGWEVVGSVPLLFRSLTLQGNYTTYMDGSLPIYLPNQQWSAALQYHGIPLKSGNLELLGRIEMRHRGTMLAPVLADSTGWGTTVLVPYNSVDAYLQIRIMDVRLFLRAENITNQIIEDLPGRVIATPRYMYGVKWNFWN